MPRAKLYLIPGYIWHITHRCHNRNFLLKFAKDRRFWLHWLFQAKKRYGLTILGYSVTSNHIHLLVLSQGRKWIIPRSIQLVASRTAREYNRRKNRSGAFWEDHYHATAVEKHRHFFQCLIYIDLNMVRAGVVRHPSEWPYCGYHEITKERQRYRIVETGELMKQLGIKNIHRLQVMYTEWIEDALKRESLKRESIWTESVAVGTYEFTQRIQKSLGIKVKYRSVSREKDRYFVKEEKAYNSVFYGKKVILRGNNKRIN